MYEELIKSLRDCSEVNSLSLYKRGLMKQAADAIEDLSKRMDESIPKSDAEIIIEELSKPRWIPVSERLPEEWWPVLGLIKFHGKDEPPAQQVLWYLGNGHWREVWRGDMIENDVTYWMPLPTPPTAEEGE